MNAILEFLWFPLLVTMVISILLIIIGWEQIPFIKNLVRRIAKGSGTEVSDINQMLKQFEAMRKMMKQMSGGGKKQAMQQMQQMFGGKAGMPF